VDYQKEQLTEAGIEKHQYRGDFFIFLKTTESFG